MNSQISGSTYFILFIIIEVNIKIVVDMSSISAL